MAEKSASEHGKSGKSARKTKKYPKNSVVSDFFRNFVRFFEDNK